MTTNRFKIRTTKDYDNGLMDLMRNGGQYERACNQVHMLIGKVKNNNADPFEGLKLTKYGETRIKKCWKYDLNKFCRLVTVRDEGNIFLCFVGKHDDCDKWLNKNYGLRFKIDCDMQVVPVYELIDLEQAKNRVGEKSDTLHGLSLNKLPTKRLDKLLDGLSADMVKNLGEICYLTDDDYILELVNKVECPDQCTAIYDVITYIREGNRQKAENRIDAFLGDLQPITESSDIHDGEDVHEVLLDSKHYQELIQHFSKTAAYQDWMLFMHPDQEEFVKEKYAGSSKISGVSGSGKTCVIVKRAIHLAKIYPNEKILILTLNRSLATLIKKLVDTVAHTEELRKNIKVVPLFRLCQEFLHEFELDNDRLYDDITWKSREHVDEVWIEYYRCELNNHDARVMQKVHDSLIARGIDAGSYIREEFDWIRSATLPHKRSDYLELERVGRSHPLDKTFRQQLLRGLEGWENKMRAIGIIDYIGLSTALYHHIAEIQPTYRSILIDESQDFGTIELEIIRKLVKPQENDLFFCGDAAQQVSYKHQSFEAAGIDIPQTGLKKMTRNYRNSREILTAAYDVFVENLADEIIDNKEFDVLDPSLGSFHGPAPLLLSGESLGQEIAAAKHYIEQELQQAPNQKHCLIFCGYTLHELQKFGNKMEILVLDGEINIDEGNIFISDLENSKGFEFNHVFILNCSATVIPYPECPEKERFRDLARLYVAMTRATTQLILSYSGTPSSFLSSAKHFLEDTWLSYLSIEPSELKLVSEPQKLKEFRIENEGGTKLFAEMTGEQFLYTDEAVGLELSLIKKIREKICGQRHTINGRSKKWKNFSEFEADAKNSASARSEFGINYKPLRALLDNSRNETEN